MAQAQLDVYSTPEPSVLAMFFAAAMGLLLKCRLGRSRGTNLNPMEQ